jgi:hypothetical protein
LLFAVGVRRLIRQTALASAVLLAALALAPHRLEARPPLEIHVSPRVAVAPADLLISISIVPDEQNRKMIVTLASGTFMRESTVDLEGTAAPRISDFRFRSLPSGEYAVLVELFDGSQRTRGWARGMVSIE